MKNQTMKNQSGHNTTVVRMTSVVPTFGFGMGDVCPDALGYSIHASAFKRHATAIKATPATATARSGFQPWSPPVT